MVQLRRIRLLLSVITFISVLAGTHTNAASANVSASYQSDSPLASGYLVSLDSSKSGYVQAANSGNGQRLLGVVVGNNDSLIALDPSNSTVQVATTGSALAVASTLNGSIKVGDEVGVSPFDGLGMKAEPNSYIIGLAQSALSPSSGGVKNETVTDKSGHQTKVSVGYIRVNIGIRGSSAVAGLGNGSSLQKFAKSLTGHYVSTARVAISIIIGILALAAMLSLTYSAIYGSIVSIGRNPLAKFAVFRTLSSVLIVAGLTVLLAGGTIYLLLR